MHAQRLGKVPGVRRVDDRDLQACIVQRAGGYLVVDAGALHDHVYLRQGHIGPVAFEPCEQFGAADPGVGHDLGTFAPALIEEQATVEFVFEISMPRYSMAAMISLRD